MFSSKEKQAIEATTEFIAPKCSSEEQFSDLYNQFMPLIQKNDKESIKY